MTAPKSSLLRRTILVIVVSTPTLALNVFARAQITTSKKSCPEEARIYMDPEISFCLQEVPIHKFPNETVAEFMYRWRYLDSQRQLADNVIDLWILAGQLSTSDDPAKMNAMRRDIDKLCKDICSSKEMPSFVDGYKAMDRSALFDHIRMTVKAIIEGWDGTTTRDYPTNLKRIRDAMTVLSFPHNPAPAPQVARR